ncbi:MAG: dihydrodipicolinate synthase family protein [Anaerolineales bacterium]|nr:dihydrodipicolinate synthase family protein [Anaerolineales bacterium]
MIKDSLNLQGVFPPLATPFREDGGIAYDLLESNLVRWGSEPLSGYVVGGSNGEFTSLTNVERVSLVRFVSDHVKGARIVIAGSGMPSTQGTIEMGVEMAGAGASALLVITPSYFKSKMDHHALVGYFAAVAEASPLPVLLYNVPANTGIDMPAETILAAARHPRIVGIKDSSGRVDKIGTVVKNAPEGFVVLAGSGGYFLGALAMGAVGTVAALANIAGAALSEILEAFQRGDIGKAQETQLRLIDVNTAVTARYGVPGLKAAMDMMGYYGGPVRPPLMDLETEPREEIRRLLVEAGLS